LKTQDAYTFRCTCSVLGWDINEWADNNSVGELNANCEAKLLTEDGLSEITERGPNGRGELWIRAPNIMKGYWKNEKATKEILGADGWLRTGDIAYVDQDGKFFIVDRIKELIKVKGNQVAPAELEALLLEHPAVADVAVIGMPTEDGDEKPRAFVVRQRDAESQQVTHGDLIQFVQEKVVYYKRLGGVVWIDEIPKNPSGKILRRMLRDGQKQKEQLGRARL
jgi:4-coumarate--CoA ligase